MQAQQKYSSNDQGFLWTTVTPIFKKGKPRWAGQIGAILLDFSKAFCNRWKIVTRPGSNPGPLYSGFFMLGAICNEHSTTELPSHPVISPTTFHLNPTRSHFDKVSHKLLSHKLQYNGISGNVLQWISSFPSNRSQQVLIEGQQYSTSAPVTLGVPQVSVLGPLLFLIFINDMSEKTSSTCRLFADDNFLIQEDKESAECPGTTTRPDQHSGIENLENAKFEVIHITQKRAPVNTTYLIRYLQLVKQGKYFGVVLSNKLSWTPHIEMVTKKANKTLAFLRRNISRCPRDVKPRCYESFVRPNLKFTNPTTWATYSNWKQYKRVLPVLSVETTTLQAVFHTCWAPSVGSPFNTAASCPSLSCCITLPTN